jgi:hypothetical protein
VVAVDPAVVGAVVEVAGTVLTVAVLVEDPVVVGRSGSVGSTIEVDGPVPATSATPAAGASPGRASNHSPSPLTASSDTTSGARRPRCRPSPVGGEDAEESCMLVRWSEAAATPTHGAVSRVGARCEPRGTLDTVRGGRDDAGL